MNLIWHNKIKKDDINLQKFVCNPEIGYLGRLGNCLFQYAAVKSLAKITNSLAALPEDIYNRVWHEQMCGLKYFKIKAKLIPNSELSIIANTFRPPKNGWLWENFDSNFLNQPANTLLYGQYEHTKYFENVQDEIREEYQLIDSIKNEGLSKLNSIKEKYPKDVKIIGIHFRLGDDIDKIKSEYEDKTSWIYKYMKHALEQFSDIENKVFVCFTGGSRSATTDEADVHLFKDFMKDYKSNDFYFESNDFIIDFSMMTQVDHLIIMRHSTFGWWASYLNSNPEKKIFIPKNDPMMKNAEIWTYKDFIEL